MKLFAKKSLGQHFLNSKHVLGQIISAAQIQKGENVLEIGPGTGILTEGLLAAGAHVIAVEKDVRAYELLREKCANEIIAENLKLISGDILDEKLLNIPAPFALVANIPYYITGAILEKFLEHEPRPNRMVLLVQKEVADRIMARDGKESILSLSVKAFGVPKVIATVPPGAFTPPPTVDSAILAISDISGQAFSSKNVDIQGFFRIIHAGFAHKRKYTMRNLEAAVSAEKLKKAWEKLALDPKVRAEDLTVDQWLNIASLCE